MSGQKKGKEAVLFPGERLDDLQLNGLELIQDPKKFCFGVDAVFLSDFVKIKAGERALDLGTGNGIIPILLSEKTQGRHFTGLEIQPEMAEMARRSVDYNGLEDKVDIVTGDIKEAAEIFKPAFFDVITNKSAVHDRRSRDFATRGTARRSHGMRCFAHLMIFCGKSMHLCRIREDFI